MICEGFLILVVVFIGLGKILIVFFVVIDVLVVEGLVVGGELVDVI